MLLSFRSRALSVAAALALAPPVVAATEAELAAGLQALTAQDVRAATIGYRLATGAVRLCPDHTGLPGFVVQDISQYRADLRPIAARLYGFGDGAAVVAVVAGGAADRAGVRAGDRLLSINDQAVGGVGDAVGKGADQDRITHIVDMIEQAFAAGPVRLGIERGGRRQEIVVAGQPGCRSAIQVELGGSVNAGADGRIITVDRGMMEHSDDDGLAFVIAHEMSHNILKHGAWLDAQHTNRGLLAGFGKNKTRILRTEMEADYHAIYVMALAGFPIAGVPAYWRGMGKYGPGIFGDGTHLGTRSRVAFLERAVAEVEAKRARGAPLAPDYAAFVGGNATGR